MKKKKKKNSQGMKQKQMNKFSFQQTQLCVLHWLFSFLKSPLFTSFSSHTTNSMDFFPQTRLIISETYSLHQASSQNNTENTKLDFFRLLAENISILLCAQDKLCFHLVLCVLNISILLSTVPFFLKVVLFSSRLRPQ